MKTVMILCLTVVVMAAARPQDKPIVIDNVDPFYNGGYGAAQGNVIDPGFYQPHHNNNGVNVVDPGFYQPHNNNNGVNVVDPGFYQPTHNNNGVQVVDHPPNNGVNVVDQPLLGVQVVETADNKPSYRPEDFLYQHGGGYQTPDISPAFVDPYPLKPSNNPYARGGK